MRKNKSLLKFCGQVVFCLIEQVFRRAFCVLETLFKLLKLIVSNNGIKSTFFVFSRFHEFSVVVVLCKNTQNIITFMVRWETYRSLTPKWTRITPTNTPGKLFHVVLHRFRRFWASLKAQNLGYKLVFC